MNTSDLVGLQAQLDYALGDVTPLTRGDLNWLFAVPEDGRLLAGGLLPNVMQWKTDGHPSNNMADLNCRLLNLTIHHPYVPWLETILAGMQASELVSVQPLNDNGQAYMTAELRSPTGLCVLDSRIGN